MSPEASLAEAEAARRIQERKHAAEQPVQARLQRIAEENDLAARFREAFSQGRQR
jgi:hypothetical protein